MIKRLTANLPSVPSLPGLTNFGQHPRFHWKYQGKPVGLKTSGNYGDLPIPCPRYFSFTQGPADGFILGARLFLVASLTSILFPLLLLPFWSKHKANWNEAAEKYGPTRYGKGKVDIL